MRNFNEPLSVALGLDTFYEEANAIFSPNEKYILTGTSVKKNIGNGKLVVLDRHTLKRVEEFDVPNSAIRILWPAKLNQIFVGTGNGKVMAFYDPVRSLGGVKIAIEKGPRKVAVDSYTVTM